MRAASPWGRVALLALCVAALIACSTMIGWRFIGPGEMFGVRADPVFWTLRVPRTALAALCGAALALGGVVFQALFRNPLAEPYTLGVASGASLAAAVGFLLGLEGHFAGVPRIGLLALGGALAAMAAVYAMASLRPGSDMAHLLLAGVCIAYLSSAGILLITYLAGQAVTNDIVVWLMGSLAIHRPRAWIELAAVLIPVAVYVATMHRAIDLLSMGQTLAAARGVPVTWVLWSCFALVGLTTATVVANCGPIGFVGLMVPHMGRALVGPRTLPLLAGSVLLGAGFLAVCDGVARSVSSYELPVGVVTNILGAVFFFYLLTMRDRAPAAGRA